MVRRYARQSAVSGSISAASHIFSGPERGMKYVVFTVIYFKNDGVSIFIGYDKFVIRTVSVNTFSSGAPFCKNTPPLFFFFYIGNSETKRGKADLTLQERDENRAPPLSQSRIRPKESSNQHHPAPATILTTRLRLHDYKLDNCC